MDLRSELVDEARRLRARGFTYERIGRTLGVGTSTIFYTLNPGARGRKAEYQREHAGGPDARERMREYRRGYFQRPGVRERMAEYQREYRMRPDVRERAKGYRRRPEVKRRRREYLREYWREYRKRPEVRERRRRYLREHRRRPEIRVSPLEILDVLGSPMTVEQISERLGKTPSAVRRAVEANAGLFEVEGERVGVAKRWKFLRADVK